MRHSCCSSNVEEQSIRTTLPGTMDMRLTSQTLPRSVHLHLIYFFPKNMLCWIRGLGRKGKGHAPSRRKSGCNLNVLTGRTGPLVPFPLACHCHELAGIGPTGRPTVMLIDIPSLLTQQARILTAIAPAGGFELAEVCKKDSLEMTDEDRASLLKLCKQHACSPRMLPRGWRCRARSLCTLFC